MPNTPDQAGPWRSAGAFTRELGRAMASPGRVLGLLHRCVQLARCTGLPAAELLRYRRELRSDRAFQAHLASCLRDVPYILPEASELYMIVRALKPGVVVETGVASGLSSAHILLALAVNGRGTLQSIDLPNVQEGSVLPANRSTGWIVPPSLREHWNLQLGDSRKLLPVLFEELGEVDVFLHDSDHSYDYMRFEFEQALPRLREGGLLLSDDTHLHTAWDDFCAQHRLRAGRIGHLGVTRKPAHAQSSANPQPPMNRRISASNPIRTL